MSTTWTDPTDRSPDFFVDATVWNEDVIANLRNLHGGGDLVTSLPSTPSGPKLIRFTDSLTAPTYIWWLSYIPAASTYKWYCVAGTWLIVENTTAGSVTSATYAELPTAGALVATTPLAGDWDIRLEAQHYYDVAAGADRDHYMSYAIGGTAASDNDAIFIKGGSGSAMSGSHARQRRKTAIAAATALTVQHRISGGTPTSTWRNRTIAIRPFRVG